MNRRGSKPINYWIALFFVTGMLFHVSSASAQTYEELISPSVAGIQKFLNLRDLQILDACTAERPDTVFSRNIGKNIRSGIGKKSCLDRLDKQIFQRFIEGWGSNSGAGQLVVPLCDECQIALAVICVKPIPQSGLLTERSVTIVDGDFAEAVSVLERLGANVVPGRMGASGFMHRTSELDCAANIFLPQSTVVPSPRDVNGE